MREFETYYLYDVRQGSYDWLFMRKGRLTGSMMGKIVGHAPYNHHSSEELAAIIKGEKKEKFTKEAIERMQKGTDYEPIVRDELSKIIKKTIHETGFAVWKADTRFGASLDGIINKDIGIEIKCPAKMYAPIKKYMENKDRDPKDIRHIWKSQYDQIITNGVITNRKKMIFCVYAIEEKNMFYQCIDVDYKYWFDFLYPKACQFYENYM
jgi:hypothetical protein